MSSASVIPTRSRRRSAVLRRVGPELLEHILTFVDETDDARAACVARDWAQTRRAWSVGRRDLDIKEVVFAPDGLKLAVSGELLDETGATHSQDSTSRVQMVLVFDAASGALQWEKRLPRAAFARFEFPDATLLAVACKQSRELLLLDSAAGETRRRISDVGTTFTFSGGTLAVASPISHEDEDTISLIDLASGERRLTIERDAPAMRLEFTGAGNSTLAVCDYPIYGDKITFYNATTGERLREFEIRGALDRQSWTDVEFSRDGTVFAEYHAIYAEPYPWKKTLGEMLAIRDALTGQVLWAKNCFCAERGVTFFLYFSDDGSTLIAPGSEACSVALYDVATFQLRRELRISSVPSDVAFSPDGSTLVASSGLRGEFHHRLVLHDVSTGELLRKAR